MNKVLIVDASSSDLRIMTGLLTKAGYDPVTAEDFDAAKEEVAKLPPGAVVITAMKFTRGTAQELINWQKREGYKFPVIAIVENLNDLDTIEVLQDHGAVAVVQRRAVDKQLVETVAKYIQDDDSTQSQDKPLIPRPSKEFREIEREVNMIGASNANVIIFGESGMGKEHIARAIYRHSGRTDKPLTMLEAGGAALVGRHNPTSEQGEMYNRIHGYFQDAAGGTIIIKNIHLLNFDKQSVLLHILSTEHPDVRVICTAEPELLEMVSEKTFRPTLFFNLREVDITVPPLRKSVEDIQPIAEYFLKEMASQQDDAEKRLDASAVKALRNHLWPGNIRELKNVIRLAAANVEGTLITASDLPISHSSPETKDSLKLRNPKMERQMIADAMAQTEGNITQAARLLGIGRTTLTYKIKQYGLK
ncbi:sigma 54-interacting transcriptional regulator [Duncaniella muris]|uniref:sigma-54-dependent transcriptional regulator n=1 Tax=Duncaniella muris TaxID=2094150 RepID=UPI00261E6B9C|nr:sigma 54-interacting transcriptional regulator [Duncaniella muris]